LLDAARFGRRQDRGRSRTPVKVVHPVGVRAERGAGGASGALGIEPRARVLRRQLERDLPRARALVALDGLSHGERARVLDAASMPQETSKPEREARAHARASTGAMSSRSRRVLSARALLSSRPWRRNAVIPG